MGTQENSALDYFAEIKNRPIGKKLLLILSVGCCACALGYCVLINVTLQGCVESWGMSLTKVQQLSNLPSLIALLGSICASPITGALGRKVTAIIGYIVLVITGVLPALTNMGFNGILVARAIGGFFVGVMIPIGTSLAADYFAETQSRFMMGFNMAFSSAVCGVALNQLAGALMANAQATKGVDAWRAAYNVFWVFVLFLLIVAIGIPSESKEVRAAMKANNAGGKLSDIVNQPGCVWKYAIVMLFFLVIGHIHSITAATIVGERGFFGGSPNVIATSFSIMTAGGAVGGLLYAFFCKPMKKFATPVMFLIQAIGMGICGSTKSGGLFFFGLFIGAGVCFVGITSLLNSLAGANARNGATVGALALMNLAYNGGEYLCPFLLNPTAARIVGADEMGNPLGHGVYLMGSALAIILCIVTLLFALKHKQGEGEHLLDF